jgi:hypothetical protein
MLFCVKIYERKYLSYSSTNNTENGTVSIGSRSDCSAMLQIAYSCMPTYDLFNSAVNGTHCIVKGKVDPCLIN